jgi:hypothetical protein
MEKLGKIAGYNILFIFAYDIILRLATDNMSVMFISMILIILQVLYNFIASITYYSSKQTRLGNSYMLTTFLVLIIGIGVCGTNFH